MAAIVKTINGLALASVKTAGGLAAASLKTINGQDASASASLPTATFTESFENGTFDNAGWTSTGAVSNVTSPAGGFTGGGTKSTRFLPGGAAAYIRQTKAGDVTNMVFRFGVYWTTLPTGFCGVCQMTALATDACFDIYMDAGNMQLRGATNPSVYALSASTWYDIEVKYNKNASSTIRVNGANEKTFTAPNFGIGEIYLGAKVYNNDGDAKWDFVQWNNTATAYIGP